MHWEPEGLPANQATRGWGEYMDRNTWTQLSPSRQRVRPQGCTPMWEPAAITRLETQRPAAHGGQRDLRAFKETPPETT